MQKFHRQGFSFIELIAVLGMLIILLAVAAPAVQQAREDARKQQCQTHLKQIGLALHNYHDTFNCFPPGWVHKQGKPHTGAGYGWQVFTLPYLDQAVLYNKLDFNTPPAASDSLMQSAISNYRCPADSTPAINPLRGKYGTSNYSGVFGSEPLPLWDDIHGAEFWPGAAEIPMKSNGIFTRNSSVKIANCTDGTSNTLMVGERGVSSGAAIWPGVSGNHNPDDAVSDGSHASPLNNSPASFSSRHPGGANFLAVDGSVRFLSDDVDSKPGPAGGVFQRLTNKADGKPVVEEAP